MKNGNQAAGITRGTVEGLIKMEESKIRTIRELQHFSTDIDKCLKLSGLLGVY